MTMNFVSAMCCSQNRFPLQVPKISQVSTGQVLGVCVESMSLLSSSGSCLRSVGQSQDYDNFLNIFFAS